MLLKVYLTLDLLVSNWGLLSSYFKPEIVRFRACLSVGRKAEKDFLKAIFNIVPK